MKNKLLNALGIIMLAILLTAATSTIQEIKMAKPKLHYVDIYYNHNIASQAIEKRANNGWEVKAITGDEQRGIIVYYVKY